MPSVMRKKIAHLNNFESETFIHMNLVMSEEKGGKMIMPP
jgi:hypothetical protein